MRKILIKMRKNKGFTQEQIAKELNIARSTYTGYELGTFSPSLDIGVQIKRILEYDNDDIFSDFEVSRTDKKKTKNKSVKKTKK